MLLRMVMQVALSNRRMRMARRVFLKRCTFISLNEKKVLYPLSVGLSGPSGADNNDDSSNSGVEENTLMFSINDEPWSLLPRTVMRPQSKYYVDKIMRRANLFAIFLCLFLSSGQGHDRWNGWRAIQSKTKQTYIFDSHNTHSEANAS